MTNVLVRGKCGHRHSGKQECCLSVESIRDRWYHQIQKAARKGHFCRAFRKHGPSDTCVLNFRPPKLRGNECLLF